VCDEVRKILNLFLGAIAAATLLGSARHGSAAAFSNGGFESPGATGIRQQISRGSVPSWTYVAGEPGGSSEFYEPGGQGGLIAADGAHYVSFGHNGTRGGSIYQDFHTVIGTTYTVTYSVAEQSGHDPTQNLRATITNGSHVLSRDNTALSRRFAAGVPITFTATTDVTRLAFADATPAGGGLVSDLALDAVVINGPTGPAADAAGQSAGWLLMLLGAAGVGGLVRHGVRGIARVVRNLTQEFGTPSSLWQAASRWNVAPC